MKKASKNHLDSGMSPEYNFRGGVRGKYVSRFKESGERDVAEILHVWAPLIGFRWAGSERQVADDTCIRPGSAYRDYEKFPEFKYALSDEERERCREVEHWLVLTHARNDHLSTKAKINSFLLALWIVRPTQTHVPFRFETTESGLRQVARVLDRFQWVEGQEEDEAEDKHLDYVTLILAPLRRVLAHHRRLKNALALTFRGCVASGWQSAFICFLAAAEAILTYSQAAGLPDRLARTYAKLTSAYGASNKSARNEFGRLYSVGSAIIHGRAYDRQNGPQNLRDLADFADMLRQLWKVVLESPKVRSALEGDDRQRQNFFLKL